MNKLIALIALYVMTICASAQTQIFYEWKDNSVAIRATSEIDSVTFSLPGDALTFTTGNPTALTENSMTASFSLTAILSISNAGSTEQGVCYSWRFEEPTVENDKVEYGSMFVGSWSATLPSLSAGTKYYYRPYLKIADAIFYGEVKSFTTLGDHVDIPDNAVDLGLPSGTFWAECNVGANSPEDSGTFFAWGETSPKSNYYWDTYKWCDWDYDNLTKYSTSKYFGIKDNKTTLEAEDDAAYVKMGSEWRMPTYAEIKELYELCIWTWSVRNDVNGYLVTGPNGNSIFLPTSGCYRKIYLIGEGEDGYYWTSSLDEESCSTAHFLYFNSDKVDLNAPGYVYRCYGRQVRAVLSR